MREILYKAKVKDWKQRPKDKQWVYGYYVCGVDMCNKSTHIIFDPTTMFYSHGETDGWEEVDPDTLCQFTGFVDKNNNKIWENDIIKKMDSNALGYHRERICKVSFDKLGYWKVMTTLGDGYWFGELNLRETEFEVIGNKFDNPEPLEV